MGGLWADLAFLFYVGACVTDYLDGALARKQGLTSDLGRMMDPIADKLLVGGLLLALAGMGGLRFGSLYAAILIMLREILISGLREYMASHNEMIDQASEKLLPHPQDEAALGLLTVKWAPISLSMKSSSAPSRRSKLMGSIKQLKQS